MPKSGRIRVGIGGWTYPPWRGRFYPESLPQKRELEYASRHLTAIEINATFYRTQSRSSFVRWRDETPGDFVFALKAPRYATHRSVLAEAGPAIERFFASGVLELGAKLGPVLWQLAPGKRFEAEDCDRFLALLPRGGRLRHALEVAHASFACAEFVDLARRHGVAVVHVDAPGRPSPADVTADFVYARLKGSDAAIGAGYAPEALDRWAQRAAAWAAGGQPADLRYVSSTAPRAPRRDVFVFVIAGAKERAPAAAQALIARL